MERFVFCKYTIVSVSLVLFRFTVARNRIDVHPLLYARDHDLRTECILSSLRDSVDVTVIIVMYTCKLCVQLCVVCVM